MKTKKMQKENERRDKNISTSFVLTSVNTEIIFLCDLPISKIQSSFHQSASLSIPRRLTTVTPCGVLTTQSEALPFQIFIC